LSWDPIGLALWAGCALSAAWALTSSWEATDKHCRDWQTGEDPLTFFRDAFWTVASWASMYAAFSLLR
jgi:hypothetical protein